MVPWQMLFADSRIVTEGTMVGFTVIVMMLLRVVREHGSLLSAVISTVTLSELLSAEEIKEEPFSPETAFPLMFH